MKEEILSYLRLKKLNYREHLCSGLIHKQECLRKIILIERMTESKNKSKRNLLRIIERYETGNFFSKRHQQCLA